MFDRLCQYTDDKHERVRVVDNFLTVLKFDCPKYMTAEDEIIEDYEQGVYSLMRDIEFNKVSALGDIVVRLRALLPDEYEEE